MDRRLPLALSLVAAWALAAPALADEADKLLAIADEHYSAQRWEQAADMFRRFQSEFPGHAEHARACYFLAESLIQNRQYSDAYTVLVDFLAEQPTGRYSKEALFRAAEAALYAGRPNEAKIRLLQFMSQYPHDRLKARVLVYLAEMAIQRNELDEAEKLFREAIELYRDLPIADESRFGLVRVFQARKDAAAADRMLEDLANTGRTPWAERALLEMAAQHFVQGDFESAIDRFRAVEDGYPNSPLVAYAQLGHGRSLYQLGRYGEARQLLSAIDPPEQLSAEVQHWLAASQKAQRESISEVIKQVEPSQTPGDVPTAPSPPARQTPKSVLARQDLGIVQAPAAAKQPDPPASEELESLSVNLDAETDERARRRSAIIRNHAAETMIRSGQYSQAIITLEIGDNTGDDPESLTTRYLLARALEGAQQHERSVEVLTQLNATLDEKFAQPNQPPSVDAAALAALRGNVQIALANALAVDEKYDAAVAPLKGYLVTPRAGEQGERARALLALCLARTGQVRDAADVLRQFKEKYPQSRLLPSTTIQVADAAYAAGRWELARECFTYLISDNAPGELQSQALAGLGWCHFHLGNFKEAERLLGQYLLRFPNESEAAGAALARARSLERLDRGDEAIAAYRQSMERYQHSPQLPQIIAALARLYDRLGDDEQAIVLYQRLVKDYPQSGEIDAALYGWAWALRDLGQGTQSDKIFRALHDQYPTSRFRADATYRLAERASQRADYPAADQLLDELFHSECPPAVLEHALYLQAQMAVARSKWDEAQPPLERLINQFPDSPLRLASEFWFAEAAYRAEDYTVARQCFEALVERSRGAKESWIAVVPLRLAQILVHEKRWQEARRIAESIPQQHGVFDQQYEADYVIGRCLVAEGDCDAAREAFQRVIRSAAGGKTETAAMAQWMLGESYFQQNEYEAALEEYLKVEPRYPYPRWQAAALLQAGKCYELLGKPHEAAEMYSHLIKRHPQTEFTADATQRLELSKRR